MGWAAIGSGSMLPHRKLPRKSADAGEWRLQTDLSAEGNALSVSHRSRGAGYSNERNAKKNSSGICIEGIEDREGRTCSQEELESGTP